MPEIRQLPAHVVNQIAAGEVIERPASVVKELMENSVDAGATRIDVSIEKGGRERIRIADNGCGIAPEQLKLAVTSHATSKIQSADDLFKVQTLGFRGEALASIASVSRFLIRSRTAEAEGGHELRVNGESSAEPAPCGCPVGTVIEVQSLFFNTPVRRKFLKTVQTEMGHVTEFFSRLALAHPQLHFTLRHNDRLIHDLPPTNRWNERIAALYGQDLAEKLIWVESEEGENLLRGYIAHPSESRSHARMQYLFLNGRFIRDRALQHALSEAYRGLLLTGRYPISFLCLDMPPENVDVNVHPTKLEVRFQDGGRHYSQMLGTIRGKFLSSDLNHRGQVKEEKKTSDSKVETKKTEESDTQEIATSEENSWQSRTEDARQTLSNWATEQLQQTKENSFDSELQEEQIVESKSKQFTSINNELNSIADETNSVDIEESDTSFSPTAERLNTSTIEKNNFTKDFINNDPELAPSIRLAADTKAIQVCNRYLIAEEGDGVVIIDQHALHERVLYEQLRERVLAGNLAKQRLLIPEPVEVTAEEAALALEHQELLNQVGLEVESFGDNTLLVSSYPAILKEVKIEELLRDALAQLQKEGKQLAVRDLIDDLLHQMSCKAAVKAGDHLTHEEVQALLNQRHLAQDAHHCPHGRPTALVFTRAELDKQFKRT
ncbi:DNA mismatch repair protein MutL [Planctomycetales bacterium 10988]|nr:DNA mismatch repair protein MutL [Planctomycetales bacterium 10988]